MVVGETARWSLDNCCTYTIATSTTKHNIATYNTIRHNAIHTSPLQSIVHFHHTTLKHHHTKPHHIFQPLQNHIKRPLSSTRQSSTLHTQPRNTHPAHIILYFIIPHKQHYGHHITQSHFHHSERNNNNTTPYHSLLYNTPPPHHHLHDATNTTVRSSCTALR